MTPTVSICIRGWRADLARDAIASALAQTYEDFEVVIADDSGEIEPVAAAFADPRVRYHRNETRLGPSPNVQRVASLAQGRYLLFLNDDDRLLPRFLERTVPVLERDERLGVVFTNHLNAENGRVWPRTCAVEPGTHADFLATYLRTLPVPVSGALMRREVWDQGERDLPMPPNASADVIMFARAALAGWPFHYVDEPLMVYRQDRRQVSHTEGIRDRFVTLWESFEVPDDPESERVRRGHLARARMSRAARELRAGRYDAARSDLAAARTASPETDRARRALLTALATAPPLVPPAAAAWRAYRRVRPFRPWFMRRSRRVPVGSASAYSIPTIAGVRLFPLTSHRDERGSFTEVFRSDWRWPIDPQQWHVIRTRKGGMRGVHVHVVHTDYKVALSGRTQLLLKDLRRGSPTEGVVDSLELRGDDLVGVIVPPGVAHAILALEDALLGAAASHTWNPADDFACHWADAELGFSWALQPAIVSERDRSAGSLRELLAELEPHQPIGGAR